MEQMKISEENHGTINRFGPLVSQTGEKVRVDGVLNWSGLIPALMEFMNLWKHSIIITRGSILEVKICPKLVFVLIIVYSF